MARYNVVQIGTVYLTGNGLVGGTPCKNSIPELSILKPAKRKNLIKAIDGSPISQTFAGIKGIDLTLKIDWLAKAVFDAINVLFDASDSTKTPMVMVVTGDAGTFNMTVVPNSDYVHFDKFSGSIFTGIDYRMVTAS